MEQEYQDITRPREVREEVKKLRKKFLRYQEAAGALYRMEKKTPSVPVGTLVLLVLTGFAAIGAYVYKKIGKKNKKDSRPDPDADYQEGEEEDYLKELEDDGNLEEDGEGPENSSDG